ncbi:MAG: hypothetical protein LBH84_00780 [Prevotellaceae bacterium]|jgi:hypothetical protein|nr:hypothetical protein [Prevotellaceae bacterium]
MTVFISKIKFYVLGMVILAGNNMLSAKNNIFPEGNEGIKIKWKETNTLASTNTLMQPDIFTIKYETGNRHIYNATDTVNRQLGYSHNFQSGIAALDNYLDIKILDGAGNKMKKGAIRAILADNPEALRKYNSGSRLYTAAAVLGIASIGVLIVRLSNPEHKYLWMSVGIGCSTGVVICRLTGTAKLKSAINLHNGTTVNSHTSNLSLNFGASRSGGLGLMLNF